MTEQSHQFRHLPLLRFPYLPEKHGLHVAQQARGHIDIAGAMPVVSAGGREYVHIVVDDYTRVVYARSLCLKSEAVNVVNEFRVAADRKSVV